jgi:hypothetical protein
MGRGPREFRPRRPSITGHSRLATTDGEPHPSRRRARKLHGRCHLRQELLRCTLRHPQEGLRARNGRELPAGKWPAESMRASTREPIKRAARKSAAGEPSSGRDTTTSLVQSYVLHRRTTSFPRFALTLNDETRSVKSRSEAARSITVLSRSARIATFFQIKAMVRRWSLDTQASAAQRASSACSLPSASATTSLSARSKSFARRTRKSRRFTWSARTAPFVSQLAGKTTSKG